jgi:hypothetical protein
MKWITRERPKIDRIACPWLIKKFVDSSAEFIYVPSDEVFRQSEILGAIPYDIAGAEYTHEGERCTFDFIVKKHGISDGAVFVIADIVRGADTDRFDLAAQASGLWAISAGLSYNMFNQKNTHGKAANFKGKAGIQSGGDYQIFSKTGYLYASYGYSHQRKGYQNTWKTPLKDRQD